MSVILRSKDYNTSFLVDFVNKNSFIFPNVLWACLSCFEILFNFICFKELMDTLKKNET